MEVIASSQSIKVPVEIAICPICGAEIVLDIDEWEEDDNGQWMAFETGVHCTCITEPDIDSPEELKQFQGFYREHFQMPYVDWLPVDMKVHKWLGENYRFKLK